MRTRAHTKKKPNKQLSESFFSFYLSITIQHAHAIILLLFIFYHHHNRFVYLGLRGKAFGTSHGGVAVTSVEYPTLPTSFSLSLLFLCRNLQSAVQFATCTWLDKLPFCRRLHILLGNELSPSMFQCLCSLCPSSVDP